MWDNYLVFLFAAHLITRLRFMHPWKLYGIPLSHIFEIPSISNEKPGISIKMYFDQKPWISIEILDSSNKKFRNTRFFTPWIWYTRYFERNSLYFKKGVKSWVFIEFYVCPLLLSKYHTCAAGSTTKTFDAIDSFTNPAGESGEVIYK